MFDHVGIAVSDLAASERFYRTVLGTLGIEPSRADAELVEWDDWDIEPTNREHPVDRGLHVAFWAPTRELVHAFWQAGVDAGHPDDGAPGPRPEYGPDYYGGFLRDPDGNSVEAIHSERANPVQPGRIDHLWIRVADLAAAKRFYATIAPHAGIRLGDETPERVQFTGADGSFSLVDDGRPLTEHVHIAFPSADDATVRAFHAAARRRGLRGQRRARRAPRLPPRLLRRVPPGPRRPQRRGREPQPRVPGGRPPPHVAQRLAVARRRDTSARSTLAPLWLRFPSRASREMST